MLMSNHRVARSWPRKRNRIAALAMAAALAPLSVQAGASQPGTAPATTATPATTSATAGTSTRLVMVGTAGGPRLFRHRGEPANVVKVDDRVYLIDAGPGVSHKLTTAGIDVKKIDKVFLTHLHFDHFGGLTSLLGFAWVEDPSKKIDIYGPPATGVFVEAGQKYLTNILNLYAAQMAPRPTVSDMIKTHDINITKPTVVYQDDKVRVTAIESAHFVSLPTDRRPLGAARSYAYRFDTADRSIVFAGDTGPFEGLAELAKGADILVSQAQDLGQAMVEVNQAGSAEDKALLDHMMLEHLAPRELGRLAAKAGVKMVVMGHVGRGADTEAGKRRVIEGVRSSFSGTIVIANDGDEF